MSAGGGAGGGAGTGAQTGARRSAGRSVDQTPAKSAGQGVSALAQTWRSRLWRKYTLVLVGLCSLGIASFGAVEMRAAFADARAQAGQLQTVQAAEAARALRAALASIDSHVGAVNALPWQPAWLGLDTRREEFGRLLRLMPAAEAISYRGPSGQELLVVSRREVDRIVRVPGSTASVVARGPVVSASGFAPAPAPASASASAPAAASTPAAVNANGNANANANAGTAPPAHPAPTYGRIAYSANHDPVLDVSIADTDPQQGGTTVVRVGLRALAVALRRDLTLPDAEVYAVDPSGTVGLHKSPSVMLARVQAPFKPDTAAAAAATFEAPEQVVSGAGLGGGDVLRAAIPLPELGWLMVVERPRTAVMAPVWATVQRTALFLALGALVAVAASLLLASRLTRPIRVLHGAAVRLEAGQLDTWVDIRTADELEDLALQFNRMAASLQANVHELEDRIAQRTRQLAQANQHKSEFLAHMSHELRTPLNAIIGFSDVLRQHMAGPLSPQQRECVDDIRESGLHLLALINDVLDLSRIEAGRLDLHLHEFAVADTIHQAAALVRQSCLLKQLELQIDVAPAVDTWVADQRRFKQVLVNLLANAVKFTPPGGRIVLRASVGRAAQGLWVEVQDTGIGIDPQEHAAVFDSFRQAGAAQTDRADGSGLGLTLVRRLVEQHGGKVSLRSAPGAGTRIGFNIPRGVASDAAGVADETVA